MYSEKKSETLVGIAYCLIKSSKQIGGGGGGGPLGPGVAVKRYVNEDMPCSHHRVEKSGRV
jgi:hypothetical protein